MSGKNDIVAGIRLDGEKQFKEDVTSVNKSITSMKSELSKVSAEYEGQANTLEALSKKQEVLNRILEEQKRKVSATKAGLENARTSYDHVGKGLEQLYADLEKANGRLRELTNIYGKSSDEAKKQQEEVDRLSAAIGRGEANYQKAGNRCKDWETKLRTAETQVIKATKAVNQNAAYLKEAEEATDGCASSIDNFGKTLKSTGEITTGWGEKIKSALITKGTSVAVDALKTAAQAAGEAITSASTASSQLAASTGLTESAAKRYQKVMSQIRANNFGQDYQDVADVMSQVIQIMGELDDAGMSNITESAITLRDTFGMDVNQSIRAADVMVKTMGVDAEKAFDLITVGAQNGLNRSGELVDNIAEYGQLWGQAGFSAEEMFAILENGLDSGAYNLDKINDYVKEFGVSLSDGRIEENLSSFSSGTQELFDKWKNGGATTRDVFYSVIDDLSKMENQQEALTLASTVWSALGEDNAMQVITALDDVNDAYRDVKGSMEELKEVKYGDLGSAISGLGSAIQEKFVAPIVDVAVPAVTDAIQTFTDIIDPPKTALQEFMGEVSAANEELEKTTENAEKTVENARIEGERLDALGEQLVSLNRIEEKSAAQKAMMKTAVDALSESIPQVAAAYDEESGKINLTDREIRKLISSKKELLMLEAAQQASQEIFNSLVEAEVKLRQAEDQKSVLDDRLSLYQEEKDLLIELNNLKNSGKMDQDTYETTMLEFWQQALDEGRVSLEEFEQATEDLDLGKIEKALGEVGGKIGDVGKESKEMEAEISGLTDTYEKAGAEAETYTSYIEDATEALFGEEKAAEKAGDGILAQHKAHEKAKESIQETAQGLFRLGESYQIAGSAAEESANSISDSSEEMADTAQAAADVQKEAAERIKSAFEDVKSEIQSGLQDKISLFDLFEDSDGGEDITVEEMQKNLDSQIEAFEEYQKNLEEVKDHVGKEIAPEFMHYLEGMGMDGANALKHILATFEDGEPEKVKELSDSYVEAMDMTEGIAEAGAANQVAYEAAMGELGSTDLEFDALRESIGQAQAAASEGWSGMSDSIRAELEDAVSAAQECGVMIPEELAAAIDSGDTGAIVAAYDSLIGIIREKSGELSDNAASGVEAGQDGVENAAASVVQAGADVMAQNGGIYTQAGAQFTSSVSEGMAGGVESVTAAASDVMAQGAEAALNELQRYQDAGMEAAKQFASGITKGAGSGVTAATNMASRALSAVKSRQGSFYSAGYNMSAGVASGISGGQSRAVNAAARMARESLEAAKKALDIHSPSKKFKKEVGEQISAGTAFGIKDKASLAGKQAEKMSSTVYDKATAWLKKYKKSHEVSLEDEKYYWEQVVKHTKKGSTAYNSALQKINAATPQQASSSSSSLPGKAASKIANNFGVSRTTTTGSGKNKKTTKKSNAEYYSEIYSEAKKYIDNRQILNEWSLQQQITYWQQVKSNLKKGTDAWYDATAQIKALQQEQETAAADATAAAVKAAQDALTSRAKVQDDILKKYKTYYKVSAKAEADYWDIARQQFTEGTDERIEADQKYFNALQEWYDQRKELDEDYAENSKDINDRLIEDIQELQDAYKEAVANRKEDILSQMNLFEAWDSTGYDGDTLLYNLKTQVAGLTLWEQQLEELGKKGLASGLMDELKKMGPEAAANIYSLNRMTAQQLAEYNKLWEQKEALAESQAIKDNETLRQETNSQINQLKSEAQTELSVLNTEYQAALQELNTGISSGLSSLITQAVYIGEEAVSGMVGAIGEAANSLETYNSTTQVVNTVSDQLSVLAQEGNIIGKNTLDGLLAALTDYNKIDSASRQVVQSIKKAMEDEAEIHSPSRLFRRETGPQIPAGVAEGIEDGTEKAVQSSRAMMQEMLASARTEMSRQQAALQGQAALMDYSGIARLNSALGSYKEPQTVVNVDNSSLESFFGTLISAVEGLKEQVVNQQMVMDSGEVVAVMRPLLDKANADAIIIKNRGRY